MKRSVAPNKKLERDVQQEIRLFIGQLPDVVIWRNQAGAGEIEGRYVKYGLCDGAADLIGICRGIFLAIECKKPRGGQKREAQKLFIELVRSKGGVAGFARSVEEAMELVLEARYRALCDEEAKLTLEGLRGVNKDQADCIKKLGDELAKLKP